MKLVHAAILGLVAANINAEEDFDIDLFDEDHMYLDELELEDMMELAIKEGSSNVYTIHKADTSGGTSGPAAKTDGKSTFSFNAQGDLKVSTTWAGAAEPVVGTGKWSATPFAANPDAGKYK